MATFTVTSLSDVTNASDGVTTLREALTQANTTTGADTIQFAPGLSGGTINLAGTFLRINESVTIRGDIDGNGTPDITVNAGTITSSTDGRAFYAPAGNSVIDGLTITGGHLQANYAGGALAVDTSGQVTLRHSVLSDNVAGAGGAISVTTGGTVTLEDSTVTGNGVTDFTGRGAGIWNNGGTVVLTDATISENIARSSQGGGIYNTGTLTLTRGTIADNECEKGAGIFNAGGIVTGTGTVFTGNGMYQLSGGAGSDEVAGGGIYNDGGQVSLDSVTFTGNGTRDYAYVCFGAAIFNTTSAPGQFLSLKNAVISGNAAGANTFGGAGIHNYGTISLENVTISNNVAETNGGGGFYNGSGAATLNNVTFAGNTGYLGGGLYNAAQAILSNVTLSGNSAIIARPLQELAVSGVGGGIFNSGTLTLSQATLSGNKAEVNGGGIYNPGTATIANTIVAGNAAGTSGPDLFFTTTPTFNGRNIFSQSGTFGAQDIVQSNLGLIFAQAGVNAQTGVFAGVLANNGGQVQTIQIKSGGIAQDAGFTSALPFDPLDLDHDGITNEPLPVDARGFGRISGGAVDIGAVEFAVQAVARNDAAITSETAAKTGNVFADNGFLADYGDVAFVVTAVNGVAGSVGQTITLASGATLRVNADGAFSYNPNHAFDTLPDDASGASNASATNSFTYTITGGSTATVTMTVRGVDSNDHLLGTAGADTLRGGIGNDSYVVENAADTVIEATGQGTDIVYTKVSYALAANQSVETLQLDASTVAQPLNITGNNIGNVLIGNAGANVLNGGAGADLMQGGSGNDSYVVDNAGDVVKENNGGGTDTVVTTVSYALTAGQYIEVLQLSGSTGSQALNLTGNELANSLIGNAGANALQGGAGADTLTGAGGRDILVPGNDTAIDVIRFNAIADSTGGNRDQILSADFNAEDRLSFAVKPTVFVGVVTAGALNNGANFNIEIGNAVNGLLNAGGAVEAVLFDPNGGGLNEAGHTYLVVDANNDGSYTANADYLVELINHTGTLDATDFI